MPTMSTMSILLSCWDGRFEDGRFEDVDVGVVLYFTQQEHGSFVVSCSILVFDGFFCFAHPLNPPPPPRNARRSWNQPQAEVLCDSAILNQSQQEVTRPA